MGGIMFLHALASFFPPLFVWNIMVISGKWNATVVKAFLALAAVFSALFFSGVMFRYVADGTIAAATPYTFLFEPYIMATFVYLLYLHLQTFRKTTLLQKTMRFIQLIGLVMFYAFALIALSYPAVAATFFKLAGADMAKQTAFGVAGTFCYCAIGMMTVFNKFTAMVTERNAAHLSLREAYKDLETTKPLRELGQSSAFINHEIKNYMMIISGYAMLLTKSKELSERDRAMADNIAQTTAKLQEFSLSVLELSKSKVMHDNKEVELLSVLRSCIDAYFPKQSPKFAVSCAQTGATLMEGVFVNGSAEKLERVFINAFRNSFEAGAQSIAVRFRACNAVALIVIDDDGAGCDAELLSNLFTTFFTTKLGAGGTGLGLCVIRSIIEAHGGNINIYSKNLLGNGKHGMIMQITLPASKRMPYETAKHEFLLIKQGLGDATGILEVLKNLKIIPHIAHKPRDADLSPRNASLRLIALAAADNVAEIKGRIGGGPEAGIIILPIETGEGAATLVDTGNGKELFTEEFVVGYLGALEKA
jgi:signal transduction histidine kinase